MFEYLFTQSQFRKSMMIMCTAWALDFIARIVLFCIFGEPFIHSTGNVFLVSFSGVMIGLIVRTILIRKKSKFIPVPEVDKNVDDDVS